MEESASSAAQNPESWQAVGSGRRRPNRKDRVELGRNRELQLGLRFVRAPQKIHFAHLKQDFFH